MKSENILKKTYVQKQLFNVFHKITQLEMAGRLADETKFFTNFDFLKRNHLYVQLKFCSVALHQTKKKFKSFLRTADENIYRFNSAAFKPVRENRLRKIVCKDFWPFCSNEAVAESRKLVTDPVFEKFEETDQWSLVTWMERLLLKRLH